MEKKRRKWVMRQECKRTDCAGQPIDIEDISGTALKVAVESGGAESSTVSGSDAGREGEHGLTHVEDPCGAR
jgi:hypothetical protein